MTNRIIATLIVATSIASMALSRTLVPSTRDVEFLVTDSISTQVETDSTTSTATQQLPPFDENAVTLRGFNKRVADNYETFFVQNNTQFTLAGITLLLRYTDINGTLLHERTMHIPCELLPGRSRQVSIISFDRQHLFYYYLSGKPRKSATAFKVSARLIGYDISILRP